MKKDAIPSVFNFPNCRQPKRPRSTLTSQSASKQQDLPEALLMGLDSEGLLTSNQDTISPSQESEPIKNSDQNFDENNNSEDRKGVIIFTFILENNLFVL